MMFDSPFERCPVCGQFVMLDQTQTQCARAPVVSFGHVARTRPSAHANSGAIVYLQGRIYSARCE